MSGPFRTPRLRRAMTLAAVAAVLSAAAAAFWPTTAGACPFCSAEQSTLSEELADSQVAVLARLIEPAPTMEDDQETIDIESGKATFEVAQVLFGVEHLGGDKEVRAIYFGEPDKESLYLIRGSEAPVEWRIPLKLTPAAVEYVKQIRSLPASGADRIAFFQDYLQHGDPMLAQDAYDEFARAPYSDLKELKDRMNHDQLLDWIEDPTTSPSRRRLYFTMLGVCGSTEDLPRLEAMLLSDSRLSTPAAEYLYAASLCLGGPLGGAVSVESVRLEERRRKL
ncbi:MAG: hypothetical protein KDA37_06260, partial [Planctomycetales bacterium]|nr:hypothetical protein [Planctomycetales bacterium]